MKKISIISGISIIIIGLSIFLILVVFKSPMDIKINKNNYENVVEKIRTSASKDDYEKAQGIISLTQLSSMTEGKSPVELMEGKSFNEMLKNLKENAENQQKEDLQKAEIENEKIRLRKTYLEPVKWKKSTKTDEYNINKNVIISLTLKNKKTINIEALEGTITIYDKLKNELANLGVKATDIISKNSSSEFTWEFSESDFEYKMDEIYTTPDNKLYFKFTPTKLLLAGNKEI